MFDGSTASTAMRKAAKAKGLSRIGKWEPVEAKPAWYVANDLAESGDEVAARCYSEKGNKSVEVRWVDMLIAEQLY